MASFVGVILGRERGIRSDAISRRSPAKEGGNPFSWVWYTCVCTGVNNSGSYRVKIELRRAIISRHPHNLKNMTIAPRQTLWRAGKLSHNRPLLGPHTDVPSRRRLVLVCDRLLRGSRPREMPLPCYPASGLTIPSLPFWCFASWPRLECSLGGRCAGLFGLPMVHPCTILPNLPLRSGPTRSLARLSAALHWAPAIRCAGGRAGGVWGRLGRSLGGRRSSYDPCVLGLEQQLSLSAQVRAWDQLMLSAVRVHAQ
jgi:hypothetical protein